MTVTASPKPSTPSPQASIAPSPMRLRAWRAEDAPAAEALIDRAFGPGRFAKTAERVREHAAFRPGLSACALFDGVLVGVVRMWSVRVGARPAVFLGPIAVEPAFRDHRVGSALVETACTAAAEAGEAAVVLVGEWGFFGPLGFSQVPAGWIALGGPVDLRRVLWKALRQGALDDLAGDLAGVPEA